MALSQSAAGRHELIWVINSATADLGPLLRLLRRLGPVVDVAGLDEAAAAAALGRERPTGITTFSDELICPTARLAARLGLAYPEPAIAERLVDKAAQRAALAAAGVPVPERWLVPAAATRAVVDDVAGRVRYPAVVKPCLGQGSRNVLAVAGEDELRSALALLGGAQRDYAVLVEEYLADAAVVDPELASYLSVESVVFERRVRHLATNGRFPTAPPFRETGFFIPAELPQGTEAGVLALVDAVVAALGIERGVLHTEVKLTPDGPRLIEVNGRPGGGVPEMLASIVDVDLYRIALDVAAGAFEPPALPLPLDRVAYLFYVQAPEARATVAAVDGLEELAAAPGVTGVFLNRPRGAVVDWRDGNHGYVYSVTGVLDDHDALRAFARTLPERVRVEVEPHHAGRSQAGRPQAGLARVGAG
jgi:biotin carboxylase